MLERIGRATPARRRFLLSLAGSALFCAAMLWLPQPAHADIADTVNSWLCGMLREFCNWIFGAQVDVLRSIGAEGVLSASFETMLGGSGTVSIWAVSPSVMPRCNPVENSVRPSGRLQYQTRSVPILGQSTLVPASSEMETREPSVVAS